MAWIVAAVLTPVILLLVVLYKRALDETMHVVALYILVLLDADFYKLQKDGLVSFAKNSPETNATALSSKVHRSICEQATRLATKNSFSTVAGAHVGLWGMKQEKK
jgi:hypothetical protein